MITVMLTDERDQTDAPDRDPGPSHGPARWQVVALVVALCFLAGVVGWWLNQPDEESFSKIDIGFLTDMETHHNGAINMSFDYLDRSHDPVVKHFAQEIISSQTQELAAMNGYLNRAGGAEVAGDGSVAMAWMNHPVRPVDMPGMPTTAERAQLDQSSGLNADDLFTHLMIRHHAGGIAMAEYAAELPGTHRGADRHSEYQRSGDVHAGADEPDAEGHSRRRDHPGCLLRRARPHAA